MKLLQDLTATRLLLRRGVEAGHWTIKDLDTPSEAWAENAKRFRLHYPNYQQHEYRNPLRDDDQQPEPQTAQPDPGYNPDAEFPF